MGKAQRKEMAETVSYEEQRRRQVEANKRKLEELQLHHLSAALREAAAKPSPVGRRRPFLSLISGPLLPHPSTSYL